MSNPRVAARLLELEILGAEAKADRRDLQRTEAIFQGDILSVSQLLYLPKGEFHLLIHGL